VSALTDGEDIGQQELTAVVPATETTGTINSLQPGTRYVFRVAASNVNGIGPWTSNSDPVVTDINAPGEETAAARGLLGPF